MSRQTLKCLTNGLTEIVLRSSERLISLQCQLLHCHPHHLRDHINDHLIPSALDTRAGPTDQHHHRTRVQQ
jgi:hypothetical protein